MAWFKVLVLSIFTSSVWCLDKPFPPGFRFGVATSAYQIEGAWNVADKSESIWDTFSHNNLNQTGDVATDSYHLWRRDVEMLRELGVDIYRFSISWSRLLPTGFPDYISADGSKYYSDLIDGLLENGIKPVVTLYHWDLPQTLENLGGWTNPQISEWFTDYARVVFTLYGDRVPIWVTINEPINMCDAAYNTGIVAPGILEEVYSGFICNKNTLIAHAKTWRLYDKEFKPKYNGKVSICNHLLWVEPESEKYENLTDLVSEFINGRYTHPIYSKEGGWPKNIAKIIEEESLKQGLPHSRLPPLTKEEEELIRGTFDYYAINYYTARLVREAEPGEQLSSLYLESIKELDAVLNIDKNWPLQYEASFATYPEGLRKILSWVKQEYGDIEILITESGYSSGLSLQDPERSQFISDTLEQLLLSIYEDNVKVTGYAYWSLMDNFEWNSGYDVKFGLYEVDFTSPMRTRIARPSAEHYKKIIRDKSL